MRLTSKGQVTIPKRLRNRYGLMPETEVVFEETANGVLLRPAASGRVAQLKVALRKSKGSAAVKSTADLMQMTRGEE